ncbi:hypothetical protein COEREDRAFT_99975 [Coemansia reversa NRRL 1564]|uniref:G-protein coupled receptors family 3 profile domain-containing protein n=1 Tax=Coemansia reversa (strain ATCC 12441 / NRRL 1564) TaxID=763665 RepID=A0A2G5B141_COERN|nr:hypothetical protein COEREDRAFT_99975 [Coemansia reversa NRRL 1564]|eukprot:PIA12736.1 hypothetical protein COEREDRAFT_99975 [Coemansia reversa NRRL 1564]
MGNILSFSLTESEQRRIRVAEIMNIHLDPRGKEDIIMIIIISIIYAIDLAAVGFLLWNRKYPPLKCKSPALMACVVLSAVLLFVGDLQTNGHVPLEFTALHNCKPFGVWVRILLGVCMLSALIALRVYGLYRIFCRNQPFRGWGLYLPFLSYCACLAVYGIVSQIVSPRRTIYYMEPVDICYYTAGYKASLFAMVWAAWFIVAFLSWKIRNIKSAFNESRESFIACVTVFAVLAFTTIMHYTSPEFALNAKLRILTTSFDHLATNVFWWSIMGMPLFKCLMYKQQYLGLWLDKLREDGLQRKYDISSGGASKHLASLNTPQNHYLMPPELNYFNTEGVYQDANGQPRLEQSQKAQLLDSSIPFFDPVFGVYKPSANERQANVVGDNSLEMPPAISYGYNDSSNLIPTPKPFDTHRHSKGKRKSMAKAEKPNAFW